MRTAAAITVGVLIGLAFCASTYALAAWIFR
jgi:hypothetical protein